MSRNSDMLSGLQITILVASAIIGTGIMTLPRQVAAQAESGSVLVTIVAGIGALILTFIIAYLGSRFPRQTVIQYSNSLLGTIVSKIINIILTIHFIVLTAVIFRNFADIVKVFLLENTPVEVIMVSMLVLTVYLVQNGINPIARICEAFFPIVIISISILFLLSLKNLDIKELYSFWQIDLFDLAKAVPVTLLSYLGFEVLLFAGAFMAEPQKIIKYGIIGISIPVLLYVATVAICIGVFSIDALKYLMYPTLEMAKSIIFPGAFAERVDVFFAIFWILAVFTTVSIYYYLAAYNVTKLIGLKNYRPFCYMLLPIIYFISLVPQNIYQSSLFSIWASYFGGAAIAFISGLLLIAALIRKKGGTKNEEV